MQKAKKEKDKLVKTEKIEATEKVEEETQVQEKPPKPSKRKNKKKKEENENNSSKKITDYFTIRKTSRQLASDLEKSKKRELENKILEKCEDGLEVKEIENKGRGVFATKKFLKGDFVVEYAGDLITLKEAKLREDEYSKNESIGCYMYYFEFKSKVHCIDATIESNRLGRLLNHSRTSNNCHTKLTEIDGKPVLVIYASRDIDVNEELLYDYGDRNKGSINAHPWLKS